MKKYYWHKFIDKYNKCLVDLTLMEILELACYYFAEDAAEEELFCKRKGIVFKGD